MAKMRVYEIAKELGVPSKTVLARLGDMGEFVRSASSTLEPSVVAALLKQIHDPIPTKKAAQVNNNVRRCSCCELMQPPHLDQFGIQTPVCGSCISHQDEDAALKRTRKHEQLLRERIDAAGKAAQEAYRDRSKYKEKMHHAYESRDRAARYLARINDQHELRADGPCSCGKRECATAATIYERWPQDMIRRHDEAERQLKAGVDLVDAWDG